MVVEESPTYSAEDLLALDTPQFVHYLKSLSRKGESTEVHDFSSTPEKLSKHQRYELAAKLQ